MSQQQCRTPVRFATTAWLLASIVVGSASVLAACHDKQDLVKQDLVGDWRGSTTEQQADSQNNVSVDMQITPVKINEKVGRFHYGPPRSCEMALIYKGVGPNDSYQFNFVESHGGFCDRLNNALLTLSFHGSDLNFVIAPSGIFKGENGVLRKGE